MFILNLMYVDIILSRKTFIAFPFTLQYGVRFIFENLIPIWCSTCYFPF